VFYFLRNTKKSKNQIVILSAVTPFLTGGELTQGAYLYSFSFIQGIADQVDSLNPKFYTVKR